MSAGVSHGADTDRLRRIAESLSGVSRQVEQAGTASMGALVESWAGSDVEVFAANWQQATPQLAAAADRLSAFARLLLEQAEEQDRASGGRGSGASPAVLKDPREVVDAIRNILPSTGGGRDG